jgi:hypothetical protein
LTAQNGSYAHAYSHQGNGNRLTQRNEDRSLFLLPNGTASEPFYIGDPDLQNAYRRYTTDNVYATDIFEDDAGGVYQCIADWNAQCNATTTFGPASYATPQLCDYSKGYWCYLYGETAIEWDRAPNPQQAYANDAIAMSNHAAHPVIGNNGVATDAYSLQWAQSPNVHGVMAEGAWANAHNVPEWVEKASHILQYHQLHKLVVEYFDEPNVSIFFPIASHWIVYDPAYSIEALVRENNATTTAGGHDTTWPEETIVPSGPLVPTPANNDVTVFQAAPGVFVREYQTCFQAGNFIGRCSAIVNNNNSAVAIGGLHLQQYGRALVHNRDRTWAAGGTAQWSTGVPSTVNANDGLILAQ